MIAWTTVAAGIVIIGGAAIVGSYGIKESERMQQKKTRYTDTVNYNLLHGELTPPGQKAPKRPSVAVAQPVAIQHETPKPVKPVKPARLPSPETIASMHKQADAERAIAEALDRKAQCEPDPVKNARLKKQAANSWLRFNTILDRIDFLTAP